MTDGASKSRNPTPFSENAILLERRGPAWILTINRPNAGNSLDRRAIGAFEAALDRLEAELAAEAGPRAGETGSGASLAVILTGAGSKFFCTGGDVRDYARMPTREESHAVITRMQAIVRRLEDLPLPVLAAVNGYALGGGLELVLACDYRIASANASLGLPQTRIGVIPGWGGIPRLVAAVGYARALELLATGRSLDAREALAWGLVQRVTGGDAVNEALAFAASLAEAAPRALRGAKQALTFHRRLGATERDAALDRLFLDLWMSDDHREAERAFTERRKPRFSGR